VVSAVFASAFAGRSIWSKRVFFRRDSGGGNCHWGSDDAAGAAENNQKGNGLEGGMFAEATGGLIAGLMAATTPIRKPFQLAQMGAEKNISEDLG